MLWIASVVIGVEDVRRAAEFWCAALGYVPREEPGETWAVLVPEMGPVDGSAQGPGAGGVQVALQKSRTPLQSHPRLHLDLYTKDREAEVERLVGLGARRVEWDSYPEDPDFVVLADPDGNVFDVIEKG